MPAGAAFGTQHFAMFLHTGGDEEVGVEPFESAGCVGIGTQFVSPILACVQRPKRMRFPKGVGVHLASR